MPINKKKKDLPAINTSALADIVFMLLCFFVTVTKMRDVDVKVKTVLPTATELQKLEEKTLLNYIYIGTPAEAYQAQFGTAPRIQLEDQFAKPSEIPVWVAKRRAKMPPNQQNRMIASLRIDGEVRMGIVTEVKTELRKQNMRKVSYLAGQRPKEK